jgi:hypothetical protein
MGDALFSVEIGSFRDLYGFYCKQEVGDGGRSLFGGNRVTCPRKT